MLSRRELLAVSAASFALGACGTKGGDALKVGKQPGTTKSLVLASGVLRDTPYRIEWSEFPAAQNLLEALGASAVDLGLVGGAPFQFAFQSGSPIRAVGAMAPATMNPVALAFLVDRASTARSLHDLRGRKVATSRGSIGHYLVLRALAATGMPADGVQFAFLSPSDAQAALQSGAVDAWSTWAPYTIAAIATGARILIAGCDFTRVIGLDVAGIVAIKAKRALLSDFLAPESRAMAWAATHHDEFAKVMSHETGLPLAIARGTVECSSRVRTVIDPPLIAEQQAVLDTFRRAGTIATARPLASAFSPLV